jgi:hypothetical protein
MTIGSLISIIFGVICIIVGIGFTIYFYGDEYEKSVGKAVSSFLIGLFIGGLLIGGAIFYLNTESGKRAAKDFRSEINNGIRRTVSVYDVNGELIHEYSGKFDVETGNVDGAPYILFDDEKGKRHIIYYTTGTILIDER